MTMPEAETVLGRPLRTSKTRRGETRGWYRDLVLIADDQAAIAEVTFLPSAKVLVNGIDLFRVSDPLLELSMIDAGPLEMAGILYFPALGITLSGFHTAEEKTLTAFARGRIDHLLPGFKPYQLA
jgi:hypothetical protein